LKSPPATLPDMTFQPSSPPSSPAPRARARRVEATLVESASMRRPAPRLRRPATHEFAFPHVQELATPTATGPSKGW
jgi:hypothetical protein